MKTPLYCKEHAEDGMVKTNHKRCAHDACMRYSYYNSKGIKMPVYCRQHAEKGMVIVQIKRCAHDACMKHASFNIADMKRPVYCKQHAEGGMVNVINKRCSHDSCTKYPSFSIEGRKPPVYCRQHAEKGMVDVNNKLCARDACTKRASFNVVDMKTPVYRKLHAKNGMVNVRTGGSSSRSRTGEAARELPTNVAATARHESHSLVFAAKSRRKRFKLDTDGKTLLRCLVHGPVNSEVYPTLWLNPAKGDCHISYFATLGKFVNDDTAGMVVEPTSQPLSLSVSLLGGPLEPEEPIKSEIDAAVLF